MSLNWLRLLAAGLCLGVASVSLATGIELPGGREAVARLLAADPDPARVIASVNRALIARVHPDHDWQKVEPRRRLVTYLATVADLAGRFPDSIDVGPAGAFRERLREVASELGYDVRGEQSGRLTLLPASGEDALQRRRVGRALGWNLAAIAEGTAGPRVRLALRTDTVPSPLSDADWTAITGARVTPAGALAALARDQRLGLIIEGRRRLSRETATAIETATWKWIYGSLAIRFFRYAAALEVEAGAVLLPGGPETAADWGLVVGAEPTAPGRFVRGLLAADNGRTLRLWHALHFLPAELAGERVRGLLAATRERGSKLLSSRRRKRKKDKKAGPYDRPHGFASLVRTLAPLGSDAAAGASIAELAITPLSRPRRGRPAADPSLLVRRLLAEASRRQEPPPASRWVVRTTGLLREQPALRQTNAARSIMLASQRGPALAIFDALELADPAPLVAYVEALEHLDALPEEQGRELLLQTFQGGVELIRLLARADHVAHPVLASSLTRWSRAHADYATPEAAVERQLAWLADLAAALPAAPATNRGRGPAERNLTAALVPAADPQQFTWRGLEYRGERGRLRAAALARRLDDLAVPSLDQLLALTEAIGKLEIACQNGAEGDARRAGASARKTIASLPSIDVTAARNGLRHLLPDRPAALATIHKASSATSERLAAARAVRFGLARELRLLLVGHAYAAAVGERSNALLTDPQLVRGHRLAGRRGAAWAPAELVHGGDGSRYILGHLSSLEGALAEFGLRGTGHGVATDSTRERLWRRAHVASRWAAVTPALSRLAAVLVAAGGELQNGVRGELATRPAEMTRFAQLRVPRARLEHDARADASLLGPSELFLLGLAALAGDDFGAAAPELMSEAVRARFRDATAALGPSWRRQLADLGAPTPLVDGRFRPWIGAWPPYEAIENEWPFTPLVERTFLDLKIRVADYLGRHDLPGAVGADLVAALMAAASDHHLQDRRDWEGLLRWLGAIGDGELSEMLYRCLEDGLYSAR